MHIAEAGAVARGPAVLYLPASGPGGSGEYVRCLMLARALARRWPDAQARFMVNRNAAYAHEVPFPSVLLDSSPTHATPAVTELLARERFDLVVFDSSGRAAQLEAAKRAGATTVFVSYRPNARRKGLRLQRVRNIDQHWIVQPEWLTAAPTPWERFKKRWLGHIRTLYLDAMLEESPPEQRGAVQREFGLEAAE
jgi:hypothetical protein